MHKILGKVEQDTRTILNYLPQAAPSSNLHHTRRVLLRAPSKRSTSEKEISRNDATQSDNIAAILPKHCTETTETRRWETGEERDRRHHCRPARGGGDIKLKTRRQTTKRRKRGRRAKQALSILCLGAGWLVGGEESVHTHEGVEGGSC